MKERKMQFSGAQEKISPQLCSSKRQFQWRQLALAMSEKKIVFITQFPPYAESTCVIVRNTKSTSSDYILWIRNVATF